MSKNDQSYRVNIRLNRTEYADVVADLERHPANEQPHRLRLLLRLGLATVSGSFAAMEVAINNVQPTAKVMQITQAHTSPQKPISRPDPFLDRNLDPADFHFGQVRT